MKERRQSIDCRAKQASAVLQEEARRAKRNDIIVIYTESAVWQE